MTKDLEDALEKIHDRLRQDRDEIEALAVQYNLNDDELDGFDIIRNKLNESIHEILRLTI